MIYKDPRDRSSVELGSADLNSKSSVPPQRTWYGEITLYRNHVAAHYNGNHQLMKTAAI